MVRRILSVTAAILTYVAIPDISTRSNSSPSRPHATAGMIAGMAIALAVSGIAFAALCVWLTVRIVNRREKWAAVLLVVVLAIYPLGFGPACRYLYRHLQKMDSGNDDLCALFILRIYGPLGRLTVSSPAMLRRPILWYLSIWVPNQDAPHFFVLPSGGIDYIGFDDS